MVEAICEAKTFLLDDFPFQDAGAIALSARMGDSRNYSSFPEN